MDDMLQEMMFGVGSTDKMNLMYAGLAPTCTT